jgi:hypothetical protein
MHANIVTWRLAPELVEGESFEQLLLDIAPGIKAALTAHGLLGSYVLRTTPDTAVVVSLYRYEANATAALQEIAGFTRIALDRQMWVEDCETVAAYDLAILAER